MTQIKIITSLDYEIFGNGSGDVHHCLIQPTERILSVADQFKVPITLMVDINEYTAFKTEEGKGTLPSGYRPAQWIEQQLISSIQQNHDVQLHTHPQWLNYSYDPQEHRWNVDLNLWRTSSLKYEKLVEILQEGKDLLEKLLKPIKQNYQCIAFRAGAWAIQPEQNILKALQQAGFKIETTVAPDCCYDGQLTCYDFRNHPNKPFWFAKDDLKRPEENGLIEYPIYTKKYNLIENIYFKLMRRIIGISTTPENCSATFAEKPKKSHLSDLFSDTVMLDFCSMSATEMLYLINSAKKKYRNYTTVPIVMIGHSKIFNSPDNLSTFFKKALERNYQFVTFNDLLNTTKS